MALTTPPILAMPTDDGEFCLDTDACEKSIGAVLSQRQGGVERVRAYASRGLDVREASYCITRKELLAIVFFLRQFKQYLLGRKFTIRTDHAALTWLRRTPDPIGQNARWLEQMEEYDFQIVHRPGTQHGNADALSRRPCDLKGCVCEQVVLADTAKTALGNTARTVSEPSRTLNVYAPSFVSGVNVSVHSDVSESASFVPDVSGQSDSGHVFAMHQCDVIDEEDTRGDVHGRNDGTEATDGDESSAVVVEDTRGDVGDVGDQGTVTGPSLEGIQWTHDELVKAQRADKELAFVYDLVAAKSAKPSDGDIAAFTEELRHLCSFWPRLEIRNELLCRRFEVVATQAVHFQVVLPKLFREAFLQSVHSGPTAGHMGLKKTAAAVQARVFWPSWFSDLSVVSKKCHECARYHRGVLPRQAEMQTPQVGQPWQRVSIDITGPHPRSARGNVYILTLVDHFSKWAEAVPIPNHTAATVAKVLVTHVFSRFGAPEQILSDQGSEFQSDLFQDLMKLLEVDKRKTSPYKPSTNGVVERFHRTLNTMLAKVIDERQRDWDDHVPFVMMAYRATQHSATGFTPNRLFLGRENKAPLDVALGLPDQDREQVQSYNDYVQNQQEVAERSFSIVRDNLHRAAERRKNVYDAKVRKHDFRANSWVWYYNPRRFQSRSPKWQSCYTGPFLITRLIPPVNCVIQRTRFSKPMVVHYDKLKAVVGRTPVSWLGAEDHGPDQGTPLPNENAQNTQDRTKKSVDVVAVETVASSVKHRHDRAPVMTSRTDRHTVNNHRVGWGAKDRSDFDVYNAFPTASLQGSRPKRTVTRPCYLKDYIRG